MNIPKKISRETLIYQAELEMWFDEQIRKAKQTSRKAAAYLEKKRAENWEDFNDLCNRYENYGL